MAAWVNALVFLYAHATFTLSTNIHVCRVFNREEVAGRAPHMGDSPPPAQCSQEGRRVFFATTEGLFRAHARGAFGQQVGACIEHVPEGPAVPAPQLF